MITLLNAVLILIVTYADIGCKWSSWDTQQCTWDTEEYAWTKKQTRTKQEGRQHSGSKCIGPQSQYIPCNNNEIQQCPRM